MQIIFNILMMFIFINMLIKLSFWKLWHTICFMVILIAYIWAIYPLATEQSQVTIQQAIESPEILSNITVLVTIESAICLIFSITYLKNIFNKKHKFWDKVLHFFPSLLVFPVIFYLLTQTIFYFSGVDFSIITIFFSILSAITIVVFPTLLQSFLPEKDLRLEIHLICSLIITILGLISTNNGKLIYVPKTENINFVALSSTFLLFFVFFIVGFLVNKIWWNIKKNN